MLRVKQLRAVHSSLNTSQRYKPKPRAWGSHMSLVDMLVFEPFTVKGDEGRAQELSLGHEIVPHFKEQFSCIK